ncbi:hypothetical protein HYR54_09595 [Candidatus Acetothermia bacterium]|nr:hypothetical protein [Candidatus Acetothermia bacterium]
MTSLLKRGAFAVLASLLVALVSANATVTGEFRIAIDPAKEVSVFFSPTTTGTIRVESVFKPLGNKYSIKLLRSDQPEPLAQAEGIDALTLTFAVDRPLPGVSWRLIVQNLADRTLSGLVEITYPRANCKELAAEFSLDLRYVNENVPLQDEQCLVMHKTMRSIPEESSSGLQKIIAFPQDPEIAGQYIQKTIRIYGDLQGARLARVFFHEMGHHIQFAHFTEAHQSHWEDLNKRSGSDSDNYARLYGRTNQFEDFATMFEAYTDSTSGILATAQSRNSRGKPILFEKVKFISALLRHDRNGTAHTYIYRTDSLFGDARILRASVALDADNVPQIPDDPEWEEF